MAHERGDVMTAGLRPGDTASAEELQRLLRARREAITHTVEEIKMTMNSGFQDTKEKVTETFDWRLQMQRYPLAAVAGAVAVGFLAGQVIGRTMGHGSGSSSTRSLTGRSTFGAGTSLAPGTGSIAEGGRPHRERHLIPQGVKSNFMSRLEEVMTDLSDNLMTEVSRVGRDIVIPTIVANLTGAFSRERQGGMSSMGTGRSYSSKSQTESASFGSTAAGGPISSSREDQQPGQRFQGRGI